MLPTAAMPAQPAVTVATVSLYVALLLTASTPVELVYVAATLPVTVKVQVRTFSVALTPLMYPLVTPAL